MQILSSIPFRKFFWLYNQFLFYGRDSPAAEFAPLQTSENSKALAKEKLTEQAEKLLLRRNYAVAMTYFKAIGNGAKVAECLRNIKMLREAYEARKRQQAGK